MYRLNKQEWRNTPLETRYHFVNTWRNAGWKRDALVHLFPAVSKTFVYTTPTIDIMAEDALHKKITEDQVLKFNKAVRHGYDAQKIMDYVGVTIHQLKWMGRMYHSLQLMHKRGVTDQQISMMLRSSYNSSTYHLEKIANLSWYLANHFMENVCDGRVLEISST